MSSSKKLIAILLFFPLHVMPSTLVPEESQKNQVVLPKLNPNCSSLRVRCCYAINTNPELFLNRYAELPQQPQLSLASEPEEQNVFAVAWNSVEQSLTPQYILKRRAEDAKRRAQVEKELQCKASIDALYINLQKTAKLPSDLFHLLNDLRNPNELVMRFCKEPTSPYLLSVVQEAHLGAYEIATEEKSQQVSKNSSCVEKIDIEAPVLRYAIHQKAFAAIPVLMAHGAKHYDDAFHDAMFNDDGMETVKALIVGGMDPNTISSRVHMSPLCLIPIACQIRGGPLRAERLAAMLLGANADPNLGTEEFNPLDQAERVEMPGLVKLLKAHGAEKKSLPSPGYGQIQPEVIGVPGLIGFRLR